MHAAPSYDADESIYQVCENLNLSGVCLTLCGVVGGWMALEFREETCFRCVGPLRTLLAVKLDSWYEYMYLCDVCGPETGVDGTRTTSSRTWRTLLRKWCLPLRTVVLRAVRAGMAPHANVG